MTLPSWNSEPKSRPHNLSYSESLGSMEDLNGTGSRGPSPLGVGFADSIPIAMAVTETFHAMFKGYDDSRLVSTLIFSCSLPYNHFSYVSDAKLKLLAL